jgi:FKBP-type peptidyl-prolyl cis-trans isomerase
LPLLLLSLACKENGENGSTDKKGALANKVDSMSYAVGLDLVSQIKNGLGGAFEFTFNQAAFQTGADEAFAGKDRFSEDTHNELGAKIQALASGIQMAKQSDPTFKPEFVSKSDFSLDNNSDSISYSLGAGSGKNLNELFTDESADKFNTLAFIAGTTDGFSGNEKIAKEALGVLMQDFQAVYMVAMEAFQSKKGAVNEAEGEAFLAENAQKEGVKTTASGLQYKVLVEGKGKSPKETDTVEVHYEGKLLNGEIFDSSIARGAPISFSLGGVIKGWTEGLQLMKAGGKYTFYIPADLAYANQGSPPKIQPGSTLVFDVELISIK